MTKRWTTGYNEIGRYHRVKKEKEITKKYFIRHYIHFIRHYIVHTLSKRNVIVCDWAALRRCSALLYLRRNRYDNHHLKKKKIVTKKQKYS